MERSDAAATRRDEQEQSWFERFVEQINHRVSRAPFFFICLAIVLVWLVSVPLWADLKAWQAAIHTISSVLALLLLVLLENAGRRSEEAAAGEAQRDRRGAVRPDGVPGQPGRHRACADAARRLRDAVGLEERH